jgi:hypothetical protein
VQNACILLILVLADLDQVRETLLKEPPPVVGESADNELLPQFGGVHLMSIGLGAIGHMRTFNRDGL